MDLFFNCGRERLPTLRFVLFLLCLSFFSTTSSEGGARERTAEISMQNGFVLHHTTWYGGPEDAALEKPLHENVAMKGGRRFRYADDTIVAAKNWDGLQGKCLMLENPINNKRHTVRVQDRVPARTRATLDLSYAAAGKLGMINTGRLDLRVWIIPCEEMYARRQP